MRCRFSTFLRLQGDHHCSCAQKWCQFFIFSKSFQKKKIRALRPKMTKIASRGSSLKFATSFWFLNINIPIFWLKPCSNGLSSCEGVKKKSGFYVQYLTPLLRHVYVNSWIGLSFCVITSRSPYTCIGILSPFLHDCMQRWALRRCHLKQESLFKVAPAQCAAQSTVMQKWRRSPDTSVQGSKLNLFMQATSPNQPVYIDMTQERSQAFGT